MIRSLQQAPSLCLISGGRRDNQSCHECNSSVPKHASGDSASNVGPVLRSSDTAFHVSSSGTSHCIEACSQAVGCSKAIVRALPRDESPQPCGEVSTARPACLGKRMREQCEAICSGDSPASTSSSDCVLTQLDVNQLGNSPTSRVLKRQRSFSSLDQACFVSSQQLDGEDAQGLAEFDKKSAGRSVVYNVEASNLNHCPNTGMYHSIRLEKEKEVLLRPNREYLNLQNGSELSSATITPVVRMLTVSWLGEAASELDLSQETLFLCVALLDRFLSKSQGCPRNLLQLVAIAALSLASKVVEVRPPTLEEMSELSANYFKVEDIIRMELVLLDELEWQTRLPTSYSFVLLYQQLFPELCPRTAALASYLTELALLYHGGLQFVGSITAAASLVLADFVLNGGVHVARILAVTEESMEELHACLLFLAELHKCAALVSEDDDGTRPLALVREKYLSTKWWYASNTFTASPLSRTPSLDTLRKLNSHTSIS